ncbi:L-amino acid N-acyltransferase YncA [Halobacillus alkaliphilus]|uniref:L-amino acid N-acyltransferase YncA n=1 Tax=Halobacillus alkaliphilus TaxID=396056 RepID=A0A1I2JVR4_9BACI|nr:GNAT family N-acetyltransferase [Halobacillus alkaliphilus]SFF57167.1 L-amino acid N-acyltransferase YncA [Halobacillus alkaliphilus]
MKIRRATITDAEGVARVQVDSWRSTYEHIVPEEYLTSMTYENRAQKWKKMITKQLVYVAENREGNIIGFSNGGQERSRNYPDYEGELYAIYVLKEHQRSGVGKRLLEPIIHELNKMNIHSMLVFVLADNNSRFFYERLGAEKIDTTEIEVSGKTLDEVVYGWKDIRDLLTYITKY